jgi:hypothetical protein
MSKEAGPSTVDAACESGPTKQCWLAKIRISKRSPGGEGQPTLKPGELASFDSLQNAGASMSRNKAFYKDTSLPSRKIIIPN